MRALFDTKAQRDEGIERYAAAALVRETLSSPLPMDVRRDSLGMLNLKIPVGPSSAGVYPCPVHDLISEFLYGRRLSGPSPGAPEQTAGIS